ncbi:hypothetical protein L541_4164 [Bordetella hinzii CA90 BAL1384]|uniref:Uncharacterized protein n=1 Tax=Bordetella hinzii OH87 BAL007II TaxID=1331262 RepID=A0ABR4R3B1_9BORD|nr:hypothetical protein L544_4624 [Bordetella hinzii OH87 BAL007II]KCB29850.1 hypothetical protein L541_4164 [Bordetella hinzii CA90 BAL1384]KCB40193.1 hypothetical protein L539_4695 [Bordetella hinzii 5132]
MTAVAETLCGQGEVREEVSWDRSNDKDTAVQTKLILFSHGAHRSEFPMLRLKKIWPVRIHRCLSSTLEARLPYRTISRRQDVQSAHER